MSDLPADIEAIADEVARAVGAIYDTSAIGRALLAERQRCAALAREEGERALNAGLHGLVPEVIARVIEGRPVRDEAGYRVDAIRRHDRAPS